MRQIPESPSTPLYSCKVTAGGSVVAIRCGRHAGILPHTSGWTQINGVNAHGLECHIELPIGNKTNIVSIMLTKGWLRIEPSSDRHIHLTKRSLWLAWER